MLFLRDFATRYLLQDVVAAFYKDGPAFLPELGRASCGDTPVAMVSEQQFALQPYGLVPP
jgi:hypothetical protein